MDVQKLIRKNEHTLAQFVENATEEKILGGLNSSMNKFVSAFNTPGGFVIDDNGKIIGLTDEEEIVNAATMIVFLFALVAYHEIPLNVVEDEMKGQIKEIEKFVNANGTKDGE